MKNKIVEDGEPLNTTDNAGSGLILPELPMQNNSIFKRFQLMKKQKRKSLNTKQESQ